MKNIVTHSIQLILMIGIFIVIQLQNTILTMLNKNKSLKVFVFNLILLSHMFSLFSPFGSLLLKHLLTTQFCSLCSISYLMVLCHLFLWVFLTTNSLITWWGMSIYLFFFMDFLKLDNIQAQFLQLENILRHKFERLCCCCNQNQED